MKRKKRKATKAEKVNQRQETERKRDEEKIMAGGGVTTIRPKRTRKNTTYN